MKRNLFDTCILHANSMSEQHYTDTELVSHIRNGDIKSFEWVFNLYADKLVRYATTILKNTYEAEDIVQQLFVQLWAKRDGLNVTSSFKSYLYRAVHNSCLNKIKQHNVKESYAQYYTHVADGTSGPASQEVEKKEVHSAIERAISDLPEQCRIIFEMSRVEQLKYQEIADKLELSVKTVENQMGKALKHMRSRLKEYMTVLVLLGIKWLE
jgi:RNA polymerase sigma-70 factor (family 1)